MNLEPLDNRVLIELDPRDKKTAGGIIIPEGAVRMEEKGVVVAAGPGAMNADGSRSPMQLKEGDHVLLDAHAGIPVSIGAENEKKYRLMPEIHVLAKITSDEDVGIVGQKMKSAPPLIMPVRPGMAG